MCQVNNEREVNFKWRVCAIAGLIVVVAAFTIAGLIVGVAAFRTGPQFHRTPTATMIFAASIIGIAMIMPWVCLCATDDNWLVRYATACGSPLLLLVFLMSIAMFLMSNMPWLG